MQDIHATRAIGRCGAVGKGEQPDESDKWKTKRHQAVPKLQPPTQIEYSNPRSHAIVGAVVITLTGTIGMCIPPSTTARQYCPKYRWQTRTVTIPTCGSITTQRNHTRCKLHATRSGARERCVHVKIAARWLTKLRSREAARTGMSHSYWWKRHCTHTIDTRLYDYMYTLIGPQRCLRKSVQLFSMLV